MPPEIPKKIQDFIYSLLSDRSTSDEFEAGKQRGIEIGAEAMYHHLASKEGGGIGYGLEKIMKAQYTSDALSLRSEITQLKTERDEYQNILLDMIDNDSMVPTYRIKRVLAKYNSLNKPIEP